MDNQHRKSSDYRELSQAEIDLMNEIKFKGEELRVLCEKVGHHVGLVIGASSGNDQEGARVAAANPAYWAMGAYTDLQVGIMKLVRAVAQPTTF
jgi:hypothetical protein